MPGSPRRTATPLRDRRAPSIRARTSAQSAARPWSILEAYGSAVDAQQGPGRGFDDLVRGGLEGAVQPCRDELGHAADEEQAADLVLVGAAVRRAEQFA